MKNIMLLLVFTTQYALAQLTPPPAPALFMEGVVSTNLSERDMAISPDGKEMYYTLQSNQHVFSTILYRRKISDNAWSAPEVAPFSGMYSDLEPAFSADGKKLFFASNRPLQGMATKDYDIWVVEKTSNGWSTAKNIGTPVNTAANEFYPSVTNTGDIYFTAEYENSVGKEDIFVSRWRNGAYTTSVALDTAVNSKLWEFNAYVSPDEKFILFTSYGRRDDQGGGDLYISLRSPEGKWLPAKNLGAINSKNLDYCPYVSADGKTFFFTSGRSNLTAVHEKPVTYGALLKAYNAVTNGAENIYWMRFEDVLNASK